MRELLAEVERYAVDGATLADMLQGCAVFELVEGGELRAAFAVQMVGDGLHCTAAAAAPGQRPVVGLLDVAAQHLMRETGAAWTEASTRRRGLVRQLKRRGWTATGAGPWQLRVNRGQ